MRLMPSHILLLVFSLFTCNFAYCQEGISFDNYFFGDPIESENIIDIETPDLKTTWIEKAEIRTETDEFDIARQRYAFRLSPSSRKVNKAIHNLKSAYDSKFSVIRDDYYRDYIESIYEIVLTTYKIDSKIELQNQLLEVLLDQSKVYQKLLDAKNSYATKWLDIQKEISDLKVNIYEDQAKIGLVIDQNQKLDWNSIIDINSIQEQVLIIQSTNIEDAEDISYTVESDIIKKEIELENAESGTYFDFLQMNYKGPGDDPLNERVSISAAFQLPMANNKSRLKIAELKNEQIELELERKEKLSEQRSESIELYDKINVLIEVYNMRLNALAELKENSNSITESLITFNEANPLFLLQQKEMIIKEELDIIKTKGEIVESYIEYLDSKGIIYSLPFKNYLLAEE